MNRNIKKMEAQDKIMWAGLSLILALVAYDVFYFLAFKFDWASLQNLI